MAELPEWAGSERLLSLYQDIQPELLRVEENLGAIGRETLDLPQELLSHAISNRGKRIRPALTVLSSKFHPNDGELPVRMATAVEMLHVATLVHDDTVDHAAVRHGMVTLSSLLGENAAVLVGDYLFAMSATWVCDTYNVRVIRRFAETIMELASGQLMERLAARDWRVTREQYWRRLYNKTASLFLTAAEAGAVLSGASEEVAQATRTYGRALGMAFQVVDDILDFEGTEEQVGKPVGNDLLQGTVTLPALMLLERYPNDNPITKLFQDVDPGGNLQRALEMIQSSSIIQDSYAVAAEFCQQAREALVPLPDDRCRQALLELTEYVTERRF